MPKSLDCTEHQSVINRENILTKFMVINEKISSKHPELQYFVAVVFSAPIHFIKLVATAQNPNAFSSSQSWLTIFLDVLSAKQLAPLPDIPTPNK